MKFNNTYVNLPERFFDKTSPCKFSEPKLFGFNDELAQELSLNLDIHSLDDLAQIFSGQKVLKGSQPIALAYAGHQFGHFVPQLGDGRALLLGEVVDDNGRRFDIQLKGSGETVFSRNGDGRSALGPVIREYIVSEAMHHLGVPTTRALAAVTTGEQVYREGMLPGAVFTRIAASHIRIGTFQYFSSRGDIDSLNTLLNYSIDRHYPQENCDENSTVYFLKKVMESQISLVANWMSIGFIHGVMNTDNMSISGETIDYGPCAFMDTFQFNQVYSFIDRDGRYAYGNQSSILQWNLARLADCLIPLVDADENKAIERLNSVLEEIPELFLNKWTQKMNAKLGLSSGQENHCHDDLLFKMWLNYIEKEGLDFTLSFRELANVLDEGENSTDSPFQQTDEFKAFEKLWKQKLKEEDIDPVTAKENMNGINPLYIPRNHQVERAIESALQGDLSVFMEMNQVLKNPYTHQTKFDEYQRSPRPEEEITATFCGT